jgi:hypothetical protein
VRQEHRLIDKSSVLTEMTTSSTPTQAITFLAYIPHNLGRNTDCPEVLLAFLQYLQTNIGIMLERSQYRLILIVSDLVFVMV